MNSVDPDESTLVKVWDTRASLDSHTVWWTVLIRMSQPLSCWIFLCTTLLPNFYPVNLQHSSCKHVFSIWVENSVDPCQMASWENSWSGCAMFSKQDKSGFSRTSVEDHLVKIFTVWKGSLWAYLETVLRIHHFYKSIISSIFSFQNKDSFWPFHLNTFHAILCNFSCWLTGVQGAQWLSGRVLDSRPKGRGFEPRRRHCVVVLEQDTFILA